MGPEYSCPSPKFFCPQKSNKHRFNSYHFTTRIVSPCLPKINLNITPFLDGFVNDTLWETMPLFNDAAFQVSHHSHVANPAVVDVLLQRIPNSVGLIM